ncbi:PCMD domain-containing protein [Parabacteroides sp. PF5-9]|uniref:PCMD domain-containing protein n=1 Tax=Parabacteroides sp. PF5-9 TaxID=1742404 RepID=UPI00247697D3|nr:PCMD domain-containing protein [Parabacteroides sp. PF5-9]MDH6359238.1 hypothetical protein [Parabacteroides sp. PF5-9]
MKRNQIYWIPLLLLFLICGCDDEQNEQNQSQTGSIVLGVEKDETLYTKAGVAVTNEVLSVTFLTESGDTAKYYNNYKQSVAGQRIVLPAGKYNVVVSSLNKEPQWDTPFYYGEKEVTVIAGQTTTAAIECSITNTKVSVKFTNAVEQYFSDYEAVVTGKSGALTYQKGETRAGFYFTEKLSVDLNLVNKNNGLKFQFNKLFEDIQPRYHYILKFDVQPPSGGENNAGGDISITINKTDSTEVECTITIPEYAQLIDIPNVPLLDVITQINGGNETNDKVLDVRKNNDIVDQHKVVITTQAGLRNLYFKVSDAFINDGIPVMFDWLKAENALKTKLSISGQEDKISESKSVYTLDLTEMVNQYLQPNESSGRSYNLSLVILDKYHQETTADLSYTIKPNLPLLATELSDQEKWATFAVLKGFCSPEAKNPLFKYGKTNESEENWQTLSPQSDQEGNLKKLITGLEPSTDYSFKVEATIDGSLQSSGVVNFTTEGTPTIPNLNFDDWYQPKNAWYPSSENDHNNQTKWWDSGNEGANTMSSLTGVRNPTSPEETIIIKNKAAKLASDFVGLGSIGKFAAGNIYVGKYIETVGTSGAKLIFGHEYVGKPTKLTGYYQYTPGIIDYAESGAGLSKGDIDQCHIYIALTTKAFNINTSDKSTLFSPDDESVIAYGELIDGQRSGNETNGFQKFEINLEYNKNVTTKPTHIVIVASASRYGDYFTGSTSSVLYLDEFELHFDYNASSFSGIGGL